MHLSRSFRVALPGFALWLAAEAALGQDSWRNDAQPVPLTSIGEIFAGSSLPSPSTYAGTLETRQVAPTLLPALALNTSQLQAVEKEGTEVLPSLPFTASRKPKQ